MRLAWGLLGCLLAGLAAAQNSSGGNSSVTPVTSIVAGTNITISPVSGTGAVTVNATGGGSGTVTGVTSPNSTITVTNGTGPTVSLDQPAQAANTIAGNNTGSATTAGPIALTPLQTANLLGAQLAVQVICDNPCSATIPSGTGTFDGISLTTGQTVLLLGLSTAANDGIYIVGSGTWTRAVNFTGSIAQNCNITVFAEQGTKYGGHTWRLVTTSAITIGTTAQTWFDATLALATTTASTSGSGGAIRQVSETQANGNVSTITELAPVPNQFDCAGFANSAGSIEDAGNAAGTVGSCAITDANGHPIFNGNGTGPTVTGTGCTKVTGATDTRGSVVTTGADVCTITWGAAFTTAPIVGVSGSGANGPTVLPWVSTAATTSAVIVSTQAAGTFNYVAL